MQAYIMVLIVVAFISTNGLSNNQVKSRLIPEPVNMAIKARWLTGVVGERRAHAASLWKKSPVSVSEITNGVLHSLKSDVRYFNLGILHLEGQGQFREYDHAIAAVNRDSKVFLIENDSQAIEFINSLNPNRTYSMSHAVNQVVAFMALRDYTLVTEEMLTLLSRRISDREAHRVSEWSISMKGSINKILLEVTAATHINLDYEIICCERYYFEFSSNGIMKIEKVEDAGSVGGYK